MKGSQLKLEDVKDFILAGKSRFTLIGESNRFTYYVMQPKFDKIPSTDRRFVKVMDTSRGNDYTYIGLLKLVNGKWIYEFRVPTKIQHLNLSTAFKSDSLEVRAFSYVWNKFSKGDLDSRVQVWHEGQCACCGRPLTTPESMITGWGPVCLKRLKAELLSESQAQFESR